MFIVIYTSGYHPLEDESIQIGQNSGNVSGYVGTSVLVNL